jgi:hypothetical protein
MKEIALVGKNGVGKFALVDDEDFEWLNQYRWYYDTDGYAIGRVIPKNRFLFKMHRLIIGIDDPKVKVDHWDRNPLNNQRTNLRRCTNAENSTNRRKSANTSSIYRGVTWNKLDKKWQVGFKYKNRFVAVGRFHDEREAALAFNAKCLEIGDPFFVLNDVK